MQVQWAIHCRYAEVYGQGGATIVGAGADVLFLPEVPSVQQLMFAVKYTASPDELEAGAEHDLRCRMRGPSGELLGELTTKGKFEGKMIIDGYVAEMIVPTAVVLEVKGYGSYGFEFSIDGREADPVPIHVIASGTASQ